MAGAGGDAPHPWTLLGVIAGIGVVAGAILTAVSAEIYDDVTEGDGIAGLDRPVLARMIEWRTPERDAWITHFTDLGSTQVLPLIGVVAAVLLAWSWRSWTPVVLLVIACGGALIMTTVGKAVVGRDRPPLKLAVPPYETSPSFPSGHTMNTWVLAATVAYLVICRVRHTAARIAAATVAVSCGLAMGLSRVYLGHHWLTDVLMAWALGTGWLVVVITAHRFAVAFGSGGRSQHPDPPPAT